MAGSSAWRLGGRCLAVSSASHSWDLEPRWLLWDTLLLIELPGSGPGHPRCLELSVLQGPWWWWVNSTCVHLVRGPAPTPCSCELLWFQACSPHSAFSSPCLQPQSKGGRALSASLFKIVTHSPPHTPRAPLHRTMFIHSACHHLTLTMLALCHLLPLLEGKLCKDRICDFS